MRRYLLVLLATLMTLLSSYAFASDLEEWAEMAKSEYGGKSITVAMATHPSTSAFQEMVDEFTKLTGIEVKWDIMEEIYLHNKLLTEHTARTGRYDVIMLDVTWLGEFVDKSVIEALDSYLNDSTLTPEWFDYEDIVPAYSEGLGQYNGTVYGIPSAGESAFIAYRKDIFDEYNVDPASIKTFDDLMEVAKKLNNPEEGIYGISMRGRRGHHLDYAWFQFLYPFGGSVFKDGSWEPNINSKESLTSLKYYLNLMKYAPEGIENFSHEEATTSFMQGKTAMWFDATALAPWIENEEKSRVVGKVGYMPPPEGPEGRYAALAGWNLAISSNSNNKDAAWAFIMFMTSRLKAEEYIEKGGVVTRTSILNDPEFIKKYPYFVEVKETLNYAYDLVEKGVDWRPRIPEWPQIGDIIGREGSLALTGQKEAEEAVDDAAKDIKELMERKGYYK